MAIFNCDCTLLRGAIYGTQGGVLRRSMEGRSHLDEEARRAAQHEGLALLVGGVRTPADLDRRADLHATLAVVGLTLRVQ